MNREAETPAWSAAATDFIAAKLAQEAVAVHFDPDAVLRDVSAATLNFLFTAVREETITVSVAARVDAAFQRGHVFCSIAVAVLKLATTAEDMRDELRDELVAAILDSWFPVETFSTTARAMVRGALKAGTNAGVNAVAAATQYDTVMKTLRLLGIFTCPDVDDHSGDEVAIYCLKPLAKDFLSAELIAWVSAWSPGAVKPAVV